ncbi:thiopurine S-methyltransferase [Pseudoduganella flava]|uniref:Methyltransferase domain-containing protein n=1 Tax=Pseudoduganella flava TaxID=871742 RepID=A0A562PLY1_9BURK|nr:methyltransferase domain-containing protein [Pseudoduganella flava]QGZ40906.1 methyltransferase domain-containing protein [Pseudoduganella flava]TWI45419.1 thiopurine S-methyltransferase [Pseudoduganella flava]
MPEFEHRDPQTPAFWDERFTQHFTPWDKGGIPERLRRLVAAHDAAADATVVSPVALVPGAGSAYELDLMCEAGWDATAIDFAPVAVARARKVVKRWPERIVEADFFTYAPPKPLTVIYERAFLCALPPDLWPRVAERWAALLSPGGLLAGYFFLGSGEKGPPFPIERERLETLLAPYFTREADEAVTDSLPVFKGGERWMEWRRK